MATEKTPDRVLDWRPRFDPKSRAYGVSEHPVLATVPGTSALTPMDRTWAVPQFLDQGQEGACVGFGWSHAMLGAPGDVQGLSNETAAALYHRAQQLDNYDDAEGGSSVLAGAQAASELGHIREYRWAFSVTDVCLALMYAGPVVVGIPWLEGMHQPDANGVIHATGAVTGGHCTLLMGIVTNGAKTFDELLDLGQVRGHNSWGNTWGPLGGEFLISVRDLESLLSQDGEACIPIVR